MAAHSEHDDPDAVLCSGCAECEWRARHLPVALSQMDPETIDTAWRRALAWRRGEIMPSQAERSLLETINAFASLLASRGVLPDRTLPGVGTPWAEDEVQFARLLCEIVASHDDLDIDALARSMDLEPSDVGELFERADRRWERAKRELPTAQQERS